MPDSIDAWSLKLMFRETMCNALSSIYPATSRLKTNISLAATGVGMLWHPYIVLCHESRDLQCYFK